LEDRITPGLFDSIRDRVENEANQRIAEEKAKQDAASATSAQQTATVQAGVPAPTDRAANPIVFFLDEKKENVRDQQLVFDSLYTGGPNFTGGVWTALGDTTGDGVSDPIVAAGAGSIPSIKVFNGSSGAIVTEFAAYETSYRGGVFVTAADVNQDGRADVIVGTDQGGGPRVRIFNGGDGTKLLADFLAIDDANFRGGVRVSMGDLNGDGVDDLIVSAGFGGGPRIAGFDGAQLGEGKAVKLFSDFFAYEDSLRNGAYVAVGYVDGDKNADLIFGGGPGGSPRVRVVSGATVMQQGGEAALANPIADFFAGNPDDRGGVRVGTIAGEDKLARIIAVGATGDAFAYDKTGAAFRQLNREFVLNSGLLDDVATRQGANPVADRLTGIFNTLKGSYAGLFTTDLSLMTPNPSFGGSTLTTQVGEVRYSIEIENLKLGGGASYNSLKSSGGLVTFTALVKVAVGGKAPIEVSANGSFTLNPFPDSGTPTSGFLSGLSSTGSDSNISANAGALAWTPKGLTGSNLSARSSEFSFPGVAIPATLEKNATPREPAIPVDYNLQVINSVVGNYTGTYTTGVTVFSPFSTTNKSVTVTLDITTATTFNLSGNPQTGGQQFEVSGTYRVQVSGQSDLTGAFNGTFTPNAFTGNSPTSGSLSFLSTGGGGTFASTTSSNLAWSPTGLTGTHFTAGGPNVSVLAAPSPFTWTKS